MIFCRVGISLTRSKLLLENVPYTDFDNLGTITAVILTLKKFAETYNPGNFLSK